LVYYLQTAFLFFTKTIQKNIFFNITPTTVLIEISRSFPGVDVKNKFSRTFLGPWKKFSKFQEFSRNSRSSANPAVYIQNVITLY
jgi:hypothetical protein